MKKAVVLALALAVWTVGCSAGGEARLKIGDHKLTVEVADTPGEQAMGLVEVHEMAEMDRALEIEADIIGINNRNLHTFAVDLNTTEALATEIPADCLGISEGGIRTKEDVKFVTDQGIHCLLVGESLMKNPDPAAALAKLKG